MYLPWRVMWSDLLLPDLNPIEHYGISSEWNKDPSTKKLPTVGDMFFDVWQSTSLETLKYLVNLVPRKTQCCIIIGGSHTGC